MLTKRLRTGLLLSLLCCATPSTPSSAAHREQPFGLEGIAAFLPIAPRDLKLGAGITFDPHEHYYLRADAVEHHVGLSANYRVKLGDVLELGAGAGLYYDFTDHKFRPAVTLAHAIF